MSVLTIDYLETTDGSVKIPVKDFSTRVIQYVTQEYTGGSWNPDNNYNWVPGAHYDFTPKRADSVIRFTARIPAYRSNAAHAISSWRFYANGVLLYQFSESETYYENGRVWEFEAPSWSTTQARIGFQVRSQANDNNELRFYGTTYWDGVGSTQNARGQMFIEERVNG